MNQKEVEAFFHEEYTKYKNEIKGHYIFKFNKNITRAGVCKFPMSGTVGQIEISTVYMAHKDTKARDIKNTVLHEIAHAIAGPDAGHGPRWKEIARRIGCNAKRCTHEFRPLSSYKYVIKCGHGCVHRRTRLSKLLKRSPLRCTRHGKFLKVYVQS